MKALGSAARILIAVAVGAALIGLEAVRVARQRAAEKQNVAAPASTGIECFGFQPDFVRASGSPTFVDVTNSWRLDFQHTVGPLGTYFMPESVGSGGALFDFDGDGRLDIYLVQSGRSPNAKGELPPGSHLESRLFRQNERGVLEDVTGTSGLSGAGYGMGCAVGDIDNDGDLDLFVTRYEQDSWYLNNADGTFSDITESCGIREKDWGTSAALFDYNRDGLLDLVVINYTSDPTYGHSVACGLQQHGLVSYCGPHKFSPTIDRLYRNDGVQPAADGRSTVRFTDVTQAAGLGGVRTFGFGVVCADFNEDGWPDMFVANDGAANCLWINQQDGTFLEEAALRGCATNAHGRAEAGMGIAIGDVNHDGHLDLIVTHLTGEKATLYLGSGDGFFQDVSEKHGTVRPTMHHTGWGTALIDFNHDGEMDFVATNGLVVPCHSGFPYHGEDKFEVRHDVIRDPQAYWRDYADQNILLLGSGRGVFKDATAHGGDFCAAVGSGRSLIYGDIDNDGDIDLIVTNCGSRAKLYRNDFAKSGRWLVVRAVDPQLKRDAYGAGITVHIRDKKYQACVSPASSYLASNSVEVHFGLGDCDSYDEIVVKWPDGPVEESTEIFDGGATNQKVTLKRGTGRPSRGKQ